MKTFNSQLTREKFIIFNPDKDPDGLDATIALSNRMAVPLTNKAGELVETIIVRAQNMHSCTRFAARIIQNFQISGSILKRHKPFDWDKTWNSLVNDYEYAFNPERWVCIYAEGEILYEKGNRHALLDVIEKCDHENPDEYDFSVPMAEENFKKKGKSLKIKYDANVALVTSFEEGQGRCGIILRGPDRTTTFSFLIAPGSSKDVNIPQGISASAAFLEGVQLAFMTGMNVEKIRIGMIKRLSKEEKQNREATHRLSRLNTEIANLEAELKVRYRPERPDFTLIQTDAEAIAQKMFKKKDTLPPRSKSAKNDQL